MGTDLSCADDVPEEISQRDMMNCQNLIKTYILKELIKQQAVFLVNRNKLKKVKIS